MATARKKDQTIDALRGLAVLLMVGGHVIGDTPSHGMHLPEGSLLRVVYAATEPVRMPIFTVISAFLFAGKALDDVSFLRFVKAKAERLLVPFVTVGTIQIALRSVVPGTSTQAKLSDVFSYYVYGGDQFWFLQSIFLVMLLAFGVERIGGFRTFGRWLGCLVVAALIHLYAPRFSRVFSLQGAFYLLPFFALGVGLARFRQAFLRPPATLLALAGFLGAFGAHMLGVCGVIDSQGGRVGPVPMLVGLSACFLLFRLRRESALLGAIGPLSLPIFLFHVLPTAGSRIALARVGVAASPVVFSVGLLAGVSFPIALHWALARYPLLSAWLLGEPKSLASSFVPCADSTRGVQSVVPQSRG